MSELGILGSSSKSSCCFSAKMGSSSLIAFSFSLILFNDSISESAFSPLDFLYRKHLQELAKLCKDVRNDVTAVKNARKEPK